MKNKKHYVSTPQSRVTLREVVSSRYLILEIVRRDFITRYRQTALGWLWAIFNPLITLLLYWVVFGYFFNAKFQNGPQSYVSSLIIGILFWNLFAASVNSVSESLLNNAHLMKKVYFPRIVFGLASIVIAFIDFVIGLIMFLPYMIYSGTYTLSLQNIFQIVLCIVGTVIFALGCGLFFAILKIKYRDFRHLMPLMLQFFFYGSSVVYTMNQVPENIRGFLAYNPLTAFITTVRDALSGMEMISNIFPGFLITLFLLIIGWKYFISFERKVIDQE